MRLVLVPDFFKGTLRAPQACAAMAEGIRRAQPEAEILSIPLADGGRAPPRRWWPPLAAGCSP